MTDEKKLFYAIQSNRKESIDNVFEYIYNKYKPLLIFVCSKYLKNKSDIDDVVQDTFMSFFNNIKSINTNIKAYLTTPCRNNALNLLKKKKRIEYIDMHDIDQYFENLDYSKERELANENYIILIEDMKKNLSEEDVDIIISHLIDDQKFDDIAITLKQNVSSIKTRYYRALKKYQRIRRFDKNEKS